MNSHVGQDTFCILNPANNVNCEVFVTLMVVGQISKLKFIAWMSIPSFHLQKAASDTYALMIFENRILPLQRYRVANFRGLTHQYWTTYILRILSNATWNMSDLPSVGNKVNTRSWTLRLRAILHSISNFQMKICQCVPHYTLED